jgi:hypothetical protein
MGLCFLPNTLAALGHFAPLENRKLGSRAPFSNVFASLVLAGFQTILSQ